MILCDTNIFIELFKGNQSTLEKIQKIGINNICLSSITAMELYFGAFNKTELAKIKKFINGFNIIHFNKYISMESIKLIEKYSKSHNLNIPDAIIGASVIVNKYKLFTYNLKDFKYIQGLRFL